MWRTKRNEQTWWVVKKGLRGRIDGTVRFHLGTLPECSCVVLYINGIPALLHWDKSHVS